MSPKLKANCYGFAAVCRNLYLSSEGRRKPKKAGKHYLSMHGSNKVCIET